MNRGLVLRVLHIGILATLTFEVAYSAYMVFVVWRPVGAPLMLGAAAPAVPHEILLTRRLYALEGWVAFVGLAVYLALTELRDRP